MKKKPNLLYVFADQMRGMDMGCVGNPDVHTPTLDRLAAEGVLCRNHFATTPVCCPNRGTLMTGTYPQTHHVLSNDLPIRDDLPTLGTITRDAGYHTGYIGKWHIDGMPRSKFTPPGPRRLGFDGFWAVHNCTHAYLATKYYRDTPELIEVEGYEPEIQTDLAMEYLDGRVAAGRDGDDSPFCLVMSWGPPHDPYDQQPQRYRDMYDPAKIQLRPNCQPDAMDPLIEAYGKPDARRAIADYYGHITALDEQLGRLLAKLEDTGVADDTLVVFGSDHGDMLWSHGRMMKQQPYHESVSVPLIMRWPNGLPAGEVNETLIGSVDLTPTFVGLMGIGENVDTFEGLNLAAAMRGEDVVTPTSVLLHQVLTCDQSAIIGLPEWRAVRTSRYTYVETVGDKPWLLFDHEVDPFELRNLVDDPTSKPILAQLHSLLHDWLKRTGDPFVSGEEMLSRLGLEEAWAYRQEEMQAARRKR